MFVLTTNRKGAIAEAEVAAAAARIGVPVFTPLSEHTRADLVLEISGRLWRVQCKWGRLVAEKGVVTIRVGGCRLSTSGYVRTTYSEREVDLLGVYCGELDRTFLLPPAMFAGKHELRLRLDPARNGQRACTTLASEFSFEGAVAQLGERDTGSVEVTGSSPVSSTSPIGEPVVIGASPFRDQLGYWMDRVAAGQDIVISRNGKPRVRLTRCT